MNVVTVSPKFQVVIPRAVRESLGIRAGRPLRRRTNWFALLPIKPITSMCGAFKGIDSTIERDADRV